MPKYLMFDHGGVLDDMIDHPTKDDLVFNDIAPGLYRALRNGKETMRLINTLVTHYGYEVVFHSGNRKHTQFEFLAQLKRACVVNQIPCPRIYAAGICDREVYKGVISTDPTITSEDGIVLAGWDRADAASDEAGGKAALRRVLEKALHISPEDRSEHIVFDDGPPNVTVPRQEGYRAYQIGSDPGAMSLLHALQDVLRLEQAKVRTQTLVDVPTEGGGVESLPPVKKVHLDEVSTYYAHSNRLFHFYKVSYNGLKGDQCKAAILKGYKERFETCSTSQDLIATLNTIKSEPGYKILATAQGILTNKLGLQTDSVKALEKMYSDAYKQVASPLSGMMPR